MLVRMVSMKESRYIEDIFIKNLPTLDLHGEISNIMPTLVKDFITTNYIMGKNKLIVIHGRHGSILKQALHKYLKSDNRVSKYYIYNMNDGITIIELKPKLEFL